MNEQELLNQAGYLLEMMETKGYKEYLVPYLLKVAQDNYPDPKAYEDKSEPQEALMLAYTRKVGETSAIKKIINFLDSQETVASNINEQNKNKTAWGLIPPKAGEENV